jgi:hypothetical protein
MMMVFLSRLGSRSEKPSNSSELSESLESLELLASGSLKPRNSLSRSAMVARLTIVVAEFMYLEVVACMAGERLLTNHGLAQILTNPRLVLSRV